MSAGLFVGERLIGFALLCAFVSQFTQLDSISGDCGLYPSFLDIPSKLICIFGAFCSFLSFLSLDSRYCPKYSRELLPFLGLVYLSLQMASPAAAADGVFWTRADSLLVEAALLLGWKTLQSASVTRFFLVRFFLEISIMRAFQGLNLKTAALNQAFPFSPIWHLNRLPDGVVSLASAFTMLFEVSAPFVFSLAPKTQQGFFGLGTVLYSVCMQLIGNFSFAMIVVFAAGVSLVPDFLVEGALGREFLLRWGFSLPESKKPLPEAAHLERAVTDLLLWLGGWTLAGLGFWGFLGGELNAGKWTSVSGTQLLGLATALSFGLLRGWRKWGLWVGLLAFGVGESLRGGEGDGTAWLLSASEATRKSLIFQVRTDGVLPEDRIYEFVLAGNFHVGETRPSHLLFGLPRVAAATRNFETSEKARDLVEKVRGLLMRKQSAVRGIFQDARINRLAARREVKDVVVYAQNFKLTDRVADHTWFARTNKFKILDERTSPVAESIPVSASCTLQVEDDKSLLAQVGNLVPLQSAAVTAAIAALIAKIIFLTSCVHYTQRTHTQLTQVHITQELVISQS